MQRLQLCSKLGIFDLRIVYLHHAVSEHFDCAPKVMRPVSRVTNTRMCSLGPTGRGLSERDDCSESWTLGGNMSLVSKLPSLFVEFGHFGK